MSRPFPHRTVLLLAGCLASTFAESKTIVLFQHGKQVVNYNALVRSLEPGDVAIFSNGQFEINEILSLGDKGDHSVVVTVDDGHNVVKFPLRRGEFDQSLIREFYAGNRVLKEFQIPGVAIDEARSAPPEYVVCERIQVKYTLAEYLDLRLTDHLSSGDRADVDRKLVAFGVSLYRFQEVGDAWHENIVFDGDIWRISKL